MKWIELKSIIFSLNINYVNILTLLGDTTAVLSEPWGLSEFL